MWKRFLFVCGFFFCLFCFGIRRRKRRELRSLRTCSPQSYSILTGVSYGRELISTGLKASLWFRDVRMQFRAGWESAGRWHRGEWKVGIRHPQTWSSGCLQPRKGRHIWKWKTWHVKCWILWQGQGQVCCMWGETHLVCWRQEVSEEGFSQGWEVFSVESCSMSES